MNERTCNGCGKIKPIENYSARADQSGRLRTYCKSCENDIKRKRYQHHKKTNPFLWKCTRTKSRAQSLKVPFDLTAEYLEEIWTGICPISGQELKWDASKTAQDAAELDRIVPEKGYIQGNVIFLSRKMNRLKSDATKKELRQILEWLEKQDEG